LCNRKREGGNSETSAESGKTDCSSSLHINMAVENTGVAYEIERQSDSGDSESGTRIHVTFTGAGVYDCSGTACTASTAANCAQVTAWSFSCPTVTPTTGTSWDVVVDSTPAGAETLTTKYTTTASSTQTPGQIEILVDADASKLNCAVLTAGQKFCVAAEVETDCQQEDNSGSDFQAVSCGFSEFSWATADANGTPVTSYTVGSSQSGSADSTAKLFCVDTGSVFRQWDPLIQVYSEATILATTLLALLL